MTWVTATNWTVVDYLTEAVESARSRTRVNAFLVQTSLVQETLRTYNALRSAPRGTSDVIWEAGTNSLLVDLPTLAVRTTR